MTVAPALTLEDALTGAEIRVYSRLRGLLELADELEQRAAAAGDAHACGRALLLRSDVLCRSDDPDGALAIQAAVLEEAVARGDLLLAGRAHTLLSVTYERTSDRTQSRAAAATALELLRSDDAPEHWTIDALQFLALYTNYARTGTAAYELMDEALRRTRALERPILLHAVLNNYAWIAIDVADDVATALPMAEELRALMEGELAHLPVAAVLDTIACVYVACDRLAEAAEMIERGLTIDDHAEPHAVSGLLITLGEVRGLQGDPTAAQELLHRARDLADTHGHTPEALRARRVLAESLASVGRHAEAYAQLHDYVEASDRLRSIDGERQALHLQALFATDAEREQRLHFEELSATDPLTGLGNRRALDARLRELTTGGAPLSLALLDIDHFKKVNDTFSHEVGDAVLVALARRLEACAATVNPDAFAARLGGEEFVLVLPGADSDTAEGVCADLRSGLADDDGSLPTVTISVGVVTTDGPALPSDLLRQADELQYRAKRDGRDRVVAARLLSWS